MYLDWSDPVDTRIQINSEIRIWIPDHFWWQQPKLKGSGALGSDGGMFSSSAV